LAKKYGFAARKIPMKNTHHAEMKEYLISKNLEWMQHRIVIAGVAREERQKAL